MKYYLDCEFNGFGGDLISIALVPEDNSQSFYCVISDFDDALADNWVAENVIPILWTCPEVTHYLSRKLCSLYLESFLKDDLDPIIISDWPDDVKYFCNLTITGPGTMINVPGLKFEVHRVDAYPTKLVGAVQHNAWWDARALKLLETGN